MNKEYKKSIGRMMSLMERMDMNLTSDEASVHEENMLLEAAGGNNIYEPYAFMYLVNDDVNKIVRLYVEISPLKSATIDNIKNGFRSEWGRTIGSSNQCHYGFKGVGKGGPGVVFFKNIPQSDWAYKKAQAQPVQTQPGSSQQQPQVANSQGLMSQIDFSSLLNSAKASSIQEQSGYDTIDFSSLLNEGSSSLGSFMAKMNQQLSQQQAQPKIQSGLPSTGQQAQSGSTTDPDSVYEWICGTPSQQNPKAGFYRRVVEIIKITASDYDQDCLDILSDYQHIYNKYRGLMMNKADVLGDLSVFDVDKIITDSLNSNPSQWKSAIQQNIQPINMQYEIFGNVLSKKNMARIMTVISDDGIQQGSSDYPTFILSPSSWWNFFRRRIVNNPKHRYPIVSPMQSLRTTAGFGGMPYAAAINANKGGNPNGFKPFYGYDITDTYLDPKAKEDYFNTRPGLKNNLENGVLNQEALNYIAQMNSGSAPSNLPQGINPQTAQQLKNAMSEEGQAKIYNGCLSDLMVSKGYSPLRNIDGSNNPLHDYAENVLKASEKLVEKSGLYTKKSSLSPLAYVVAYGLCTMSVGLSELESIMPANSSAIAKSYAGDKSSLVKIMMDAINGMREKVELVIRPLTAIVNSVVVDTPAPQQQAAVVEEDVSKLIDSLLNEMKLF